MPRARTDARPREHPDRRRPAGQAARLPDAARGAEPEPRTRRRPATRRCAQVLEREFAVILLDVNMPGIDGLETASLIRSRKKSAHTPIIFVTADYGDELRMTQGVFARRGRLHRVAGRARDPAREGQGVRRAVPARRAGEAAGAGTHRARRGKGRARGRRTRVAQARVPRRGERHARELARPRGDAARAVAALVPRFADVCLVSLASGEGQAERHEMAWATSDPEHPLLTASIVEIGDRDAARGDRARARVRQARKSIERDPAGPPASRIALPRGLTAHALMLVPLARARPHARRADARARVAGAPLRCGHARDGGRARDARGDRARQRAAVPQDPGGGPAQERVPRDARARAAQSAGADQQRRAHPARQRRRPGEARMGARADRAPAEAARAAGRRPARRVAHHARQDRAQDRRRRRRAGGGGGDRDEQARTSTGSGTRCRSSSRPRRCTCAATSRASRRSSRT